ncbi:MAG: M48 family metallopeptidase [Saprospiraceae bacterium]|nr:M48 family metallopeptidase [Saprospiraceae bacterium]
MIQRRRKNSKVYDLSIKVEDRIVPMRLFTEYRKGWRIALADKAIHLRIPYRRNLGPSGDPLVWARKWLVKKYRQQPHLFERYNSRLPESGQIYKTVFGDFTLEINPDPRKTPKGTIQKDRIIILYPITWTEEDKLSHLSGVISRTFAKAFRVKFKREVERLNRLHYDFQYHDIRLRHTHSTWGSCTPTGNLNFSTRLFLAPLPVMQYVIIHELAHLGQPNHSRRFWRLVERAMPTYKDKVKWLKESGVVLGF